MVVLLTSEGFKKFKDDHRILLEKRKEVLADLVRAREMGDLSENGAYKAARFELSSIDRRIRELTKIIKTATVITNNVSDRVQLGNKVNLLVNGRNVGYQVVGRHEANPSLGMVSNESPIGRKLLGKKVGDKFVLGTDKKYNYEILSLN